MDQEPPFTEYDQLVHSKDIQILKTMLPFIDAGHQMPLAIFIQFIEFKNTIHIFQKEKNVLSIHATDKESDKTSSLLNSMRQYISPKDREALDNIMNIIGMMNMMSMMESPEGMGNIMNMMGAPDNMADIMNMMQNPENIADIMHMMEVSENTTDVINPMKTPEDMPDIVNIPESQEDKKEDIC